ncbi:MAG: Asp-tRNA(Asn)/Glu-tRNA(Gln) amidotransferase subunit GatC [Aaplasma endosymbiont of Hyalomma asiaticum]
MKYSCIESEHQPISRAELTRVSKLVRIRIGDDEVDSYCEHLGAVVSWFGMLAEVDDAGVDAAIHGKVPDKLLTRDDIVTDGDIRDEIMANSHGSDMGFFTVKNVLQ